MLKFPYIPDLDKLFTTYLEVLNSNYTNVMETDPYIAFLLKYGFIEVDNGIITKQGNYDLSNENKRMDIFFSFLTSMDVPNKILLFISKKAGTLNEIVNEFSTLVDQDTIRVIIAWFERLNQIKLSDSRYQINEDLTQDAENKESIYPLSYDNPLEISEDKYSVYEYLRKVNRGMILMDPDFQRTIVWTPVQKSRFIESTILQLPIPPLYLKRRLDGKLVVIDGLQRTNALNAFVSNEFSLCSLNALAELNGKNFNDLKEDNELESLATRIEDKQLLFYVLGSSVPMRIVYDIFNRINTGGTKLEPQEVRNCVFIGNSTELLKDLASHDIFKKSIDFGISDKRMKAREAILRCLSFVLFPIDQYQGSIDDFLEKTMKKLNAMSNIEIEDIKQNTIDTFQNTYDIFGNLNFRIPSGETRGRINVALMEAVFNCFWKRTSDKLNNIDLLNERFYRMVRDKDFLDSFRMSTSSKSGVKTRFSTAHKYLDYD